MTATVRKHLKKETKNESDKVIIDRVDIPSGLKELLVSHSFTITQLLSMKSGDIAEKLGIDQDAARLIVTAVRRKVQPQLDSQYLIPD